MATYAPQVHLNNQKLPKLTNATEYYRWREESTDVFLQKSSKIWRIVKGEWKKPDEATDSDKFEEWTDANYTAVGLIRSSLSIEIKHTITELENAHEIWVKLEQAFAKTMKWRLEELETEFNSLKQEKLSIDAFVGKIKELSEQLQLGGVTVSMHKKFTVLMKGLRREYENIKAQIEETYRNQCERNRLLIRRLGIEDEPFEVVTEPIDEKAEFDNVVAKLRSKELELGLHGLTQRSRQNVALLSDSRKSKPNNRKLAPKTNRPAPTSQKTFRPLEEVLCFKCTQKGHYANKCPNEKKPRPPQSKKVETVFITVERHITGPDSWVVDTGASCHICVNKDAFDFIRPVQGRTVITADNTEIEPDGVGTVTLRVRADVNDIRTLKLTNVLYVPTYTTNLLSGGKIQKKAALTLFKSKMTITTESGDIIARGTTYKGLTYLDVVSTDFVALSVSRKNSGELWHKRLGHPSLKRVQQAAANSEGDFVIGTENQQIKCDVCEVTKSHKQPFGESRNSATRPLELVHSDVVGKMPDATFKNQHFAVTFIDDFSRFVAVFLLEHKSQVFGFFQLYKQIMETQTGHKIKRFRTDNGGEFTSKEFEDFLEVNGIIHETTAPYTPEQNGIAERMNRTLFEMVRCLLKGSGAPASFWGEALLHASYLVNRLPTKAISAPTPYKALTNRKTDLRLLRIFGCAAWAHIPSERRTKLDDRAVRTIFIGIATDTKGYKLYDPITRTILVTRHATFDEKVFPFKGKTMTNLFSQTPQVQVTEEHRSLIEQTEQAVGNDEPVNDLPVLGAENDQSQVVTDASPPVLTDAERAAGLSTPPGTPPDTAFLSRDGTDVDTIESDIPPLSLDSEILDDEPRTLAQALKRPDARLWQEAIDKELQSHKENNTWTLSEHPKGKNIIGCRYVFKVKRKADGTIDKYKVRLVAQGYTQQKGIDYEETFAPVVKISTLRILLILSLSLKLEVYQMDVTTAYLNGDIDTDLYMKPPPGWTTPLVCKLNKALYGLKQSGRTWYSKADSTIRAMGFTQSPYDSALYFMTRSFSAPIMMTLYVDDILIFAAKKSDADNVMSKLRNAFKMTGGDRLAYILGIQVTMDGQSLHLSQTSYLRRLLVQFGLEHANIVHTPSNSSADLTTGEPLSADAHSLYRTIVGSVLYMATCTRPDISFAVQKLSRHLQSPTESAMTAAKHLLRYLKGTEHMGLRYFTTNNQRTLQTEWGSIMTSYSDADFAGDSDTRKSTSGIVNTIDGMPYSWISKRQNLVTDSTTFAEYVAMAEASKEIIWCQRLLSNLGFNISEPTPLMANNQAAIQLSKDPKFHNRTKHIDVKYHFTREQQENKTIIVKSVSTHDQLADIFTKPLEKIKVAANRSRLNINLPDASAEVRPSVDN